MYSLSLAWATGVYSGGAGGSSGFAACVQPVNSTAMSSTKAAPKKAFALVFELVVFILKTSLKICFVLFKGVFPLKNPPV